MFLLEYFTCKYFFVAFIIMATLVTVFYKADQKPVPINNTDTFETVVNNIRRAFGWPSNFLFAIAQAPKAPQIKCNDDTKLKLTASSLNLITTKAMLHAFELFPGGNRE